MKRVIVFLSILLSLAGCSHSGNSMEGAIEKEVCPVVDSYLENAAAGNWQGVFDTLTGDALSGAKANAGQVKAIGEKIVSKKYKVSRVGDSMTRVDADFTKSTAEGFDRLAYSFDMIRSGDRWKIYKTTWGQYLYSDLKPGQLPADAAGVIKAYLEASYSDKRVKDHTYLSGKLLQDSKKSKSQPVETKTYGELQKILTTVKSLECLGLSNEYALVQATCDVDRENKSKQIVFLIEAVLVNGTWKISNIENL